MCEGGWEPTIEFITTVHVSDVLLRFMQQKAYCYRIDAPINITMHIPENASMDHNKISGLLLADVSRSLLARALNKHNVFIYQEDDIMLQYNHLTAYLTETRRFMNLFKHANESALSTVNKKKYYGMYDHCFGFQRYRRKLKTFENRNFPMSDKDIIHQELLDEVPLFKPVCILGHPYVKVTSHHSHAMTNPHQAMFILTRQQILIMQEKCKFLNQTLRGDELIA